MSYESAAITRQAILDHLHAHGRKSASQIVQETGLTKKQVDAATVTMTRLGEVEKIGKGQGTSYTALVKKTTSPEDVHERVKIARELSAKRATARKQKPGHYIHNPWAIDHVAPTNQCGQGSGRSRVYVSASAGML